MHTPGEWQHHDEEYCPEEIYGNLELIDGKAQGTLICEVKGDFDESQEVRDNAKLIIAAPGLLAACIECLAVVDECYEATGHIRVARTSTQRLKIEAAIRKAQ